MFTKEMFKNVLKEIKSVQQINKNSGIIKNMKEIGVKTQEVKFDRSNKAFYQINNEMNASREALNELVKMGMLRKEKTTEQYGSITRQVNAYYLTDKAVNYIHSLKKAS